MVTITEETPMTEHQHDQAAQPVYRPRCSPAESAPRLAASERPCPDQLRRDRERAAGTWRKGRYPW